MKCFSETSQDSPITQYRMDLGSWTIFSLLDKEFSAQIRLACVFGERFDCFAGPHTLHTLQETLAMRP